MKKKYASFLATAFVLVSLSLKAQSLKSLDDNNGFKTHKLGSKYTPVYGIKTKEEDGSEKVVRNSTGDKIGDIPVKTIELFYLKDTLAMIVVKVTPEYHTRLIEACKNSFGAPTQDRSDNEASRKKKNENLATGKHYKDQYIWKSKRINMEYFYQYPIVDNSAYTVKDLHLTFALNDYPARLARTKKGSYTPKDF